MCLILFSYKNHDEYKLILAANRDEFYERPTLPMQWWENKEGVLAGIDEDKHGTWLGINKNGRFAALTNYRQMPITEQYDSSRGFLVSEFLSSDVTDGKYLEDLEEYAGSYDGYNLIFGEIDNLSYYSNRGGESAKLEPGTYGLSNHLLNTPWPKVQAGMSLLSNIATQDELNPSQLFAMLSSRMEAPDNRLPDTGVGLELERMLSAAFIDPIAIGSPEYGTRCSTVLLVDWDNNVTIEERSFVPKAENKFKFAIG